MPRLLSTLCTASLLVAALSFTGCSTIYRPVYSPNKTRYRPPPEKPKKSDVDLLPPETTTNALPPIQSTPPSLPPSEPTPPPGMLDAAPTIPGLPPP